MHVSIWHSLVLTPDALMICRLAYTPTLLHCGLAASLRNMRLTVGGAKSTSVHFWKHISQEVP